MFKQILNSVIEQRTNLIFFMSLIATLGSLFMGHFVATPCELCWYQRIAMYPIAVITGLALLNKEKESILKYVLPLASIGAAIAAYHYFIQMTKVTFGLINCNVENPCVTVDWSLFGFITIPFLSLVAFLIILILLSLPRIQKFLYKTLTR